ncbi:MAG: GNAT family N-acetyltransferase [Pseudomonadota bacterium]
MRLFAMKLEDDHVRLEPLHEGHRKALRALADDPELWALTTQRGDGDWFDGWFDTVRTAHAKGLQISFAVFSKAANAYAGHTSYLSIAPDHQRVEIGWTWYAVPFRGGAVNPACKRLLLTHAFKSGAERVELKTHGLNQRSQRAMEKLGAVREGVLRSHTPTWKGDRRDTVFYSILKSEWPEVEAGLDARLGARRSETVNAITVGMDDPMRDEVKALLKRHAEFAEANSPPQTCHYFQPERLTDDDVSFWTAREGDAVLGCIALKALDDHHGEIKSMHVAEAARGRGVARMLVQHLIEAARGRGMTRLSLETGRSDGFAPSRALYAAMGFEPCEPFADYTSEGFSYLMSRAV